MWDLVKRTGGVITSCESFTQAQFTQCAKPRNSYSLFHFCRSLAKLFSKDEKGWLKMGFNLRIEVKASKELQLQGAIGSFSLFLNFIVTFHMNYYF